MGPSLALRPDRGPRTEGRKSNTVPGTRHLEPSTLLPYCLTALLPHCLIALLPYCPTALLPSRADCRVHPETTHYPLTSGKVAGPMTQRGPGDAWKRPSISSIGGQADHPTMRPIPEA